LLLIIFEMKT